MLKGSSIPYRVVIRDGVKVTKSPASYLPSNAVFAMRSENGGVDSTNCLNWASVFVKYTAPLRTKNRKVLLVYDGYRSHLSLPVLKLFKQNGIVIYALPAHSSGKTQPLDTVVFSSFKGSINETLQTFLLAAPERSINLYGFCAVLSGAYRTAMTKSNIPASFRRAGLWPLDRQHILGIPRPASNRPRAKILSPRDLEVLFKRSRKT